jgi:hypothetical protein
MTGECPQWLVDRMEKANKASDALTPEERLAAWKRQMKAHQEYEINYGFDCVKKIKEAKYIR